MVWSGFDRELNRRAGNADVLERTIAHGAQLPHGKPLTTPGDVGNPPALQDLT